MELSPIADGGNLTLSAGKEATVRCLSRGGNPAANVKWFLDDRELVGQYNQTNTTDIGKVKTWMAVSTLTYTFNKTDHSKLLRCVALHEAYPTKSRESSVTLDIHCKSDILFSFVILSSPPDDDSNEKRFFDFSSKIFRFRRSGSDAGWDSDGRPGGEHRLSVVAMPSGRQPAGHCDLAPRWRQSVDVEQISRGQHG